MGTVFLTCAALGSFVLAAQVLLGFLGLESDLDLDTPDVDVDIDLDADDPAMGLDLLSVRALSAGIAVFGAAGLLLDEYLLGWLAAAVAILPGFAAALLTAWATRWMLSMETSGSLRLEGAIGQEARVYLTVPANGEGTGLVHVPLQGRRIELKALTRGGEPLPTGSSVTILDLEEESETVEVISTSSFERQLHEDVL